MNYPTPMDIAEHEDRDADMSAVDRLANICAALEEDLNESPFTREEWKRLDAERIDLLAANEALASELAECAEKRERYALQVCLLLDAIREAGVHITENWCWCAPTVTNHGDSEQQTNVNNCKTYDKDGKLLTVCHNLAGTEARLADAEALLREARDGYMDPMLRSRIDAHLSREGESHE